MVKRFAAGMMLLLAGCDGGGGGGSSPPRIVEGVKTGVSTRSSTDRAVIAYASAGRLMVAEATSDGFFFDAAYTLNGGDLSGSARIYGTSLGVSHARYFTQTATVTGTVTADGWAVTIVGASSTTTVDLVHDPADTDNSSLTAVEGAWVYDPAGSNASTLTINADGTTGSTNASGCASAGTIAPVDPDFNLYDSATTVSDAPSADCPSSVEGSYTGLIAKFDPAGTGVDQLVVMLAKSDFMFRYAYDRQP